VMALSPLLQIRRMISQQSSRDVSIGYFCVLLGGFALWLAYGAAIANLALVVPNAVAFAVGSLTVGVAVRYRPPRRGRQPGSPKEADVP
jgi:MtN3 and saliva related transmembrane protein